MLRLGHAWAGGAKNCSPRSLPYLRANFVRKSCGGADHQGTALRNSSGSLAKFTAIRRTPLIPYSGDEPAGFAQSFHNRDRVRGSSMRA
jgi:hypothetical protein